MHRIPRPSRLALTLALLPLSTVAAEPTTLPTVAVVGTAPLPGVNRPLAQIPANIIHIGGSALHDSAPTALAGALDGRIPGWSLNATQGNPFQPDVSYRGFSASPLLGAPQGVSVFVDGVRANAPFGDTVHWDLLPRMALASATVLPGSNPLFGLNTLGGALNLRTKDGFMAPGSSAEASAGSFGARSLSAEHGLRQQEHALYLAASHYREDGWRDASGSENNQVFGKCSWRGARSDASVSLAHARSLLIGNGLLPLSMLAQRRAQIFTHPDFTGNTQTRLNIEAGHWLDDNTRLAANLYVGALRTRTLNGDVNDEFEDGPHDLAAAGSGRAVENGASNRTHTRSHLWGAGLQWSRQVGAHQIAIGASFDSSRSRFAQTSEIGDLDAGRGVLGSGDVDHDNELDGQTRTASLYLTDTWSLTPTLHLTAAGRFNRTRVYNVDQLQPLPPNLDADYTYSRFNPALGINWQAAPALTLYAGANQGNRAPTPIELGCADPANPCSLPNAMAADPYLKQVLTRTVEAGARGRLAAGPNWQAALWQSRNRDDILFVGTSTSQGYFTNYGQTRRRGVELALHEQRGRLDWRLAYGWVRATFGNDACLLAENNSTRGTDAACTGGGQDDEILIRAGNRIPGVPEHNLKLGLGWLARPGLRVGAEITAHSGQYLRGNENNAHQAGTFSDAFGEERTFSNGGRSGGYALLNLTADWRFERDWSLFGRIDNALDRRYASGGALAENPFTAAGAFSTDSEDWGREAFVAPGAARSFWIGLRYRPRT